MRRAFNVYESWLKVLLRPRFLRVLYGTTLAEIAQSAFLTISAKVL